MSLSESAGPEPSVPAQRRRNPLILVIEDDPVSRNILTNIFRNEGYDVIEEPDGTTGLETALQTLPDLICLDIVLPSLSGFEVCRSIRQSTDGSDIPILIVTSLTRREDIIKGLKSGANDYILKPFSPVEVMARAKVNLQRRIVLRDLLERTDQFLMAWEPPLLVIAPPSFPAMLPSKVQLSRSRREPSCLIAPPLVPHVFPAKTQPMSVPSSSPSLYRQIAPPPASCTELAVKVQSVIMSVAS